MNKAKWIFLTVILLLDLLLLPHILVVPFYLKEHGLMPGLELWKSEWSFFKPINRLFHDKGFLKLWGLMQLVVAGLTFLALYRDTTYRRNRISSGIGGPEAGGNGQQGTSRWETEDETDLTSTVWKLGTPVKRGGIVLGMDPKKKKVWMDTEDTNVLLIGASRSGKSRFIIKPTIWELAQSGESMVITDPKGELYESTAPYLRSKGYKVKLLDFIDPGRGNRWNPMNLVKQAIAANDISEASDAAWNAAHMFANQKASTGESIWTDGAESVISSLILAIATEADTEGTKHMSSVYKTLAELGETIKTNFGEVVPLTEYIKGLAMDHPARDAYTTARLSPERMRGSFFANVSSLLRLFADPKISWMTADQDHDLADVGREKTAVFLVIPDENTTKHPIAALYVDQTYQSLVAECRRRASGRLAVRVNMLLDEWGNMPPIKDFKVKQTVSLGRGMRWIGVVQDFGQIKDAYKGVTTSTITGNFHTWIYLLTADPDTANQISRKTGMYTVETQNYSSTMRSHDTSSGLSVGTTGRRLLNEDEVMRWPKYRSLVLRTRAFPAHLPLPDLSEWPADREFTTYGDSDEIKTTPISKVPFFVPGLISGLAAATEEASATERPLEENEEKTEEKTEETSSPKLFIDDIT